MDLISDVKPTRLADAVTEAATEEKVMREMQLDSALKEADTRMMIKALYERGIPYSYIFGTYYELEEAGEGRMMTIQDAIDAGFDGSSLALDCA